MRKCVSRARTAKPTRTLLDELAEQSRRESALPSVCCGRLQIELARELDAAEAVALAQQVAQESLGEAHLFGVSARQGDAGCMR